MAMASVMPVLTAIDEDWVEPLPSCPIRLYPQHHTWPWPVSAQVWAPSLPAMAITPVNGRLNIPPVVIFLGPAIPLPIGSPQHLTMPSASSEHASVTPVTTAIWLVNPGTCT